MKSRLDSKTKQTIFNEFDKIQEMLYSRTKVRAKRRYSEPRNCGFGYRCKWYDIRVTQYRIDKIAKSLPKGWTIESLKPKFTSNRFFGFSGFTKYSVVVKTNSYLPKS